MSPLGDRGGANLDTDFWSEGMLGFTTIRPEHFRDAALQLVGAMEKDFPWSSMPVINTPAETIAARACGATRPGDSTRVTPPPPGGEKGYSAEYLMDQRPTVTR